MSWILSACEEHGHVATREDGRACPDCGVPFVEMRLQPKALSSRFSVLEGERDELREKLDAALGREGSLALDRNRAIRERDRARAALEQVYAELRELEYPKATATAGAALESLSGGAGD